MSATPARQFSDLEWLRNNVFNALKEISELLAKDDSRGRDALIRVLEFRSEFDEYGTIINSLVQKAGLYPYLVNVDQLSTAELLNYEFHTVDGLDDIVLHTVQGKVYRALCDGANVILSAPTSFGKSLLIDVMIASGKFRSIVVVVPTIALIDETRRRLSKRFGTEFKVITHPTQSVVDRNIFVVTQERYVEFGASIQADFFVVDEFYKLSPSNNDDRTFVLNQAFYQLLKTGAQFFLIGPNIQDISVDPKVLSFRYFQTDFSTVATEVEFSGEKNPEEKALEICRKIEEPTLMFCKSARSAYKLASYLDDNGIGEASGAAQRLANWIRDNYHPDWELAKLLDAGFAVHHGALPRSVAYHILRMFNSGKIRFLLCTSTIIEGVNTSAKNIIIYDNKIATTKFDQFTFNNIKGRAGRMFQHFVGRVFVLQDPPQPELPFVDIPSVTQPDGTPESLLIQIEDSDLSEHSKEQLKYLHAQDVLSMDVIRENSGMQPYSQLHAAEAIFENLQRFHPQLSWTGYPTNSQLRLACQLIFEHLMDGKGKDGARTAKQLHFTMGRLVRLKRLDLLIADVLENDNQVDDASSAVESVLKFQRNWAEFHFPRYLHALDLIQRSVFARAGLTAGNYEVFGTAVKRLFLPVSATLLEEYGLPHQVTMKIEALTSLGETVDEVLSNLQQIDPDALELTDIEREMFDDTLANL